jgi:transcriptional regulator with XRE-family HTH domain
MAQRGDPNVLRLVVVFLRFHADMTQTEFAKASRVDQSLISKYERLGKQAPPEASLRRMAEAAGVDWPVVAHLRHFYAAVLAATARRRTIPAAEPLPLEVLEPALLAITPYLIEDQAPEPRRERPEEAQRNADHAWSALERMPNPRRRWLLERSPPATRSCALAVRVCAASLKAACHDAREALVLAELALFIAERLTGGESLRARTKGYCWGHIANARRVGNDFDGSDEAFARAWGLWRAGASADCDLLPEWRLLSLEASLRRAQHRFPEALKLLDRARAGSGNDPKAAARILLQKEHVFHLTGEIREALASLGEAAPFVETAGDPNLLFSLRFNLATDLWLLERYDEAAELLPRVQEIAVEQANALDLIRVQWLDARIAAGQGWVEAAIAGLEQVCQSFEDRELPYDAALASLDLAVLWLEGGRTAEVRELAVGMAWIFEAQGIHREALAALTLFCEAAKQEAATVDLARRIGKYLCRAQHDPELRFDPEKEID